MPVTSYSTTPASNNSAAPNGAPEGMSPGDVNDTIRQIMTDVAVESQRNSVKVLGSVAGTNTITASMSPALTAYAAGTMVVLIPANTNTGAVTLNINSLGALDVQKLSGSALAAGDLAAGVPVVLVLDSGADDWIALNPALGATTDSGSFTGTFTGMASSLQRTVTWWRTGRHITMSIAQGTAVSNANTMTLTGMPAALWPTVTPGPIPIHAVYDNSADNFTTARVTVSSSDGTISFMQGSAFTFTASGNKGINAGPCQFTYIQ